MKPTHSYQYGIQFANPGLFVCQVVEVVLPKVNTTKYGLKSLRYEGANLWNKLPNEYRKADSYKLFKKQISDTDLAGRYMS